MQITTAASQRAAERTQQLGAVAELLLKTPRASFRLSALRYWIQPAFDVGQLKVFYDKDGRPVGYCTWAFVGDELLHRLMYTDVLALHLSEWNEGLNLWIVDFVADEGYSFSIARWMRRHMFPHHSVARAASGDAEDGSRVHYTFRRSAALIDAHKDAGRAGD